MTSKYSYNGLKPFPMELLKNAMLAKGGSGNLTSGGYNPETDEALVKRIEDASELYPALRSLSYRLPGRPGRAGLCLTEAEMVTILENLMDTSVAADAAHVRHDDWLDRRRKISELVQTAIEKNDGPHLTEGQMAAMQQGESFFKTQEMIAKSSRPTGPQRETTLSDIEKRVAGLTQTTTNTAEAESADTNSIGSIVALNAKLLRRSKLPPIKWVLPRMIPEMATVSLAGMSNVGKTRWIAGLLMGLAVGDTKRMGLPQCGRKISSLWVANEERIEDIARRVKAVTLHHGDKKSADIYVRGKGDGMLRLVALNETGIPEIDEKNVAGIVAEVRKHDVRLVVFDPYVTLSDAASENDASSAAMLTKAFLLISSATGAAVMHAHHTPKDRGKDNDWVRGDASAWRGSGAIYSALDCGFTLANWMPHNSEQKKSWRSHYLTAKLSRWVVLDTGKIREGEDLDPVVYELVGQEMDKGEGDPIGVCRLADEAQAGNALLDAAIDVIAVGDLAHAMVNRLGEGEHKVLATIHNSMKGYSTWPSGPRLQGRDLEAMCSGVFTERWVMAKGGYSVKFVSKEGKGTEAKLAIVIKADGPEVE